MVRGRLRQRRRRDVTAAVVQRFVDLVTDEPEVVPDDKIDNRQQLGRCEDGADGVPGIVQEQRTRSRRAGGFEGRALDCKPAVMDGRTDRDRAAAKQCNRRGIGIIDGIGEEDFVAGLKDRAESQGNAAGGTVGDQDFAGRII
jgi:hypothetical protein